MAINLDVKLNEDTCPVPDQLFGQLRQASPAEAAEITKALPESQRARLAAFFYNKRHLHALGLVIASTCSRHALLVAGGNVGETIYLQSRDPEKTMSTEMQPPGSRPVKPISLAKLSVSE